MDNDWEELGEHASCWVSASSSTSSTSRHFPLETAFRDQSGGWVRAKDLVEGGKNSNCEMLSGDRGTLVKVQWAKMSPHRSDLMRVRCATGNILLPGEHEVKVEGKDSVAVAIQASSFRKWPGRLPRLYDGAVYQLVDCVETYHEPIEMVEVCLEENMDLLAWTDYPRVEVVPPVTDIAGAGADSPYSKRKTKEKKKEDSMISWISAADYSSEVRAYPANTFFKLEGRLLSAEELAAARDARGPDTQLLLQGARNALCAVKSVSIGDRDDYELLRIRSTNGGSVVAVPKHRILVEGSDGRPIAARLEEVRAWPGPLPALYTGSEFKAIDLAEVVKVPCRLVTLQFVDARSSVFAWSSGY